MSYNGYTGKDIVDATKTMVAGQHKVSEQQVKVSFTDEMTDTKKKPSVVSSELVKALKGEMTKNVLKN